MSQDEEKETLELLDEIADVVNDIRNCTWGIIILLVFIAIMMGIIAYYLLRYIPFPK